MWHSIEMEIGQLCYRLTCTIDMDGVQWPCVLCNLFLNANLRLSKLPNNKWHIQKCPWLCESTIWSLWNLEVIWIFVRTRHTCYSILNSCISECQMQKISHSPAFKKLVKLCKDQIHTSSSGKVPFQIM